MPPLNEKPLATSFDDSAVFVAASVPKEKPPAAGFATSAVFGAAAARRAA